MDCWDRHGRLSAISAIRLSPQGRRLELFFSVWDHNITTEECQWFVVQLLRELRGPVRLVWDGWSVHRAAARRLQRRFARRLQIDWLPAYAPELNPVEQVWGHAKYGQLANFLAKDLEELDGAVRGALAQTAQKPHLLRSFFHHAGLDL